MNPVRPPRSYRAFQVVYAALTANFFFPALSYMAAPEETHRLLDRLNRLLGGGPWVAESLGVWHMLAVGNVMTLALMCFLLLLDLRRFHGILPVLMFLKAYSALYSLFLGWHDGLPAFYAVFLLDGATTLAMGWFAERAYADLTGTPRVPLWAFVLLPRPRQIRANLALVAQSGLVRVVPNLWQVFLGTLYMRNRLVFRPYTVGTSSEPVRPGLRARILAWRAFRFPFLVAERAVAPFELSGLALDVDRLIVHLVGAHHDGAQFAYDLELLAIHPDGLARLHAAVASVAGGTDARARWLQDLCVFSGYHAGLLAAVERARAGDLYGWIPAHDLDNPDVTLRAWLRWCAAQPATPSQTLAALTRGALSFRPVLPAGA